MPDAGSGKGPGFVHPDGYVQKGHPHEVEGQKKYDMDAVTRLVGAHTMTVPDRGLGGWLGLRGRTIKTVDGRRIRLKGEGPNTEAEWA